MVESVTPLNELETALMPFFKRKRTLDASVLKAWDQEQPKLTLQGVPSFGVGGHISNGPTGCFTASFEETWQRMPLERCWNMLGKKRMRDLFPHDPEANSNGIKIADAFPEAFKDHVMVGVRDGEHPGADFVHRNIFHTLTSWRHGRRQDQADAGFPADPACQESEQGCTPGIIDLKETRTAI